VQVKTHVWSRNLSSLRRIGKNAYIGGKAVLLLQRPIYHGWEIGRIGSVRSCDHHRSSALTSWKPTLSENMYQSEILRLYLIISFYVIRMETGIKSLNPMKNMDSFALFLYPAILHFAIIHPSRNCCNKLPRHDYICELKSGDMFPRIQWRREKREYRYEEVSFLYGYLIVTLKWLQILITLTKRHLG
jgi:hypothetical protein